MQNQLNKNATRRDVENEIGNLITPQIVLIKFFALLKYLGNAFVTIIIMYEGHGTKKP